jgi:hypothetical protein
VADQKGPAPKTSHCGFQNRPLRVETGQYPKIWTSLTEEALNPRKTAVA